MKKNIFVAYVLWLLVGIFAAHKFYCRKFAFAVVHLICTILGGAIVYMGWYDIVLYNNRCFLEACDKNIVFVEGIGVILLFISSIWIIVDIFFIPLWVVRLNVYHHDCCAQIIPLTRSVDDHAKYYNRHSFDDDIDVAKSPLISPSSYTNDDDNKDINTPIHHRHDQPTGHQSILAMDEKVQEDDTRRFSHVLSDKINKNKSGDEMKYDTDIKGEDSGK